MRNKRSERANEWVSEREKTHRQRWKTMENSSKDFSLAKLIFFFLFRRSHCRLSSRCVLVCYSCSLPSRLGHSAAASMAGGGGGAFAVILMCHLYARILHNSKHVLFCIKRYLMLSFLCRFASFAHRRRQPFVFFSLLRFFSLFFRTDIMCGVCGVLNVCVWVCERVPERSPHETLYWIAAEHKRRRVCILLDLWIRWMWQASKRVYCQLACMQDEDDDFFSFATRELWTFLCFYFVFVFAGCRKMKGMIIILIYTSSKKSTTGTFLLPARELHSKWSLLITVYEFIIWIHRIYRNSACFFSSSALILFYYCRLLSFHLHADCNLLSWLRF